MTDTNDDAKQVRRFADWLLEQRFGALHDELSERLAELGAAVDAHRKPGSLTLVIKMKPAGAEGMVEVHDDVKPNIPQPAKGGAYYYTDADGNLRRENPNQMTFDSLREVRPADDADPVTVDTQTGEVIELKR